MKKPCFSESQIISTQKTADTSQGNRIKTRNSLNYFGI